MSLKRKWPRRARIMDSTVLKCVCNDSPVNFFEKKFTQMKRDSYLVVNVLSYYE